MVELFKSIANIELTIYRVYSDPVTNSNINYRKFLPELYSSSQLDVLTDAVARNAECDDGFW